MKNKRLWFRLVLIIVGLFVVFMILVLPDLVKRKTIGPGMGAGGRGQATGIAHDLRSVLHKDSDWRTYYGGLYLSGEKVVVLVTGKYKNATPEVKEFIKENEGIILKKCKYTLLELDELQDELWEKLDELVEKGNEKQKEFLDRFVSSALYENTNCVGVGIKDMTIIDCIRFRIMFGLVGDYRIEFESVGEVILD